MTLLHTLFLLTLAMAAGATDAKAPRKPAKKPLPQAQARPVINYVGEQANFPQWK
jgi:hypothetical protein